jgi:hypothetical protein
MEYIFFYISIFLITLNITIGLLTLRKEYKILIKFYFFIPK